MKSTLCVQNPAVPTQVKKINFKSHFDAYQAGTSLEKIMNDDGIYREMPLVWVKNEDGSTLALCNGKWWTGKQLEDKRIVPGDEKIAMNIEVDESIGENIRDRLPLWAFTWGSFLR